MQMRQANPPNIQFIANKQQQRNTSPINNRPRTPTPVRFSHNQVNPNPIINLPIHQSLYVNPTNKLPINQYNLRVSQPSPRVYKLQKENSRLEYNQLQSPQQIDYNNYNKTVVRTTISSLPQKKNVQNTQLTHVRSSITSHAIFPQQQTQNRKNTVMSYAQRPHYQKRYPKEDIRFQKQQQNTQKKGCCSWPCLLILGLLALLGLIAALILAFSLFSDDRQYPVATLEDREIDQYATKGSTVVIQQSKIVKNETNNNNKNQTLSNSQTNGTVAITNQQQQDTPIDKNTTVNIEGNTSVEANGTTSVNADQQVNSQPHTSPGIPPPEPDTEPGLSPATQYRFPGTLEKVQNVYKPIEQKVPVTQYQLPENQNTDFQYAPDNPLFGTYYGTSLRTISQVSPIVTHLQPIQKRIHRLKMRVL